jgi:tRNA pseudouridine32 synthase/23S rRNA pseudouridine746 synthase
MFPSPFRTIPDPIAQAAADELKDFLKGVDLKEGRMFGVLVAEPVPMQSGGMDGETKHLWGYSGTDPMPFEDERFVPLIHDIRSELPHFAEGEKRVHEMTLELDALRANPQLKVLRIALDQTLAAAEQDLKRIRQELKSNKKKRDAQRKEALTPAQEEALQKESLADKAWLRDARIYWQEQCAQIEVELQALETDITELDRERRDLTVALQKDWFEAYTVTNYSGNQASLFQLFTQFNGQSPPAGAGECAGPKLIAAAYAQGLKPVALAEFWWGPLPKKAIRREGQFYPACRGRCEPILNFMLKGLDTEPDPMRQAQVCHEPLEYVKVEDDYAVIYKPAGMLSVPGNVEGESVFTMVKRDHPEATGPIIVHRLDQATSGLMIVAFNERAHQYFQKLFIRRYIKKTYRALLDGVIEQEEGTIELPLAADPIDRPRQVVDRNNGKPSITKWKRISVENGRTWVHFFPQTGRTHQLRVHAAHPEGLKTPIVGDRLYGRPAERLYLYAEKLEFRDVYQVEVDVEVVV